MIPIQVPDSLQTVRGDVLEGYVRQRLRQFASHYSGRILQLLPPGSISGEALEEAAQYVIARLPVPESGPAPLERRPLQLVFRHDCMALGCLDPQCALCQHNPNRRCSVNFDRKYLVNDVLKAKCGAHIRVELIDRQTGQLVDDEIADLRLEMYVLDGNLYDTRFLENAKDGGPDFGDDLESFMLLLNKKKNAPLLVAGAGGSNDAVGKVQMPIMNGKAALPDLHVTDSSEAILSGRKPPFRLLVRAILPESRPGLKIHHAISEGFVVATRRTRTAGKVDIPSIEDHVSKLEHMGKETVKKLQDIRTAAAQAGIDIDIPENCVLRVGDFKMLSMRAEQDGHLRQRLQHVLKLSKEKWEEARDHAMRAVAGDGRMRAWYADRRTLEVGLLFATRLGCVDLDRPVALLQHHAVEGGPDESKVEATLMAQQTPAQRDLVRQLQPQAAHSWWQHGHPGWAIFPMDTDQFLQSGMQESGFEVSPDPSRANSEGGYGMPARGHPGSNLMPPPNAGGGTGRPLGPFGVQQHPGMGGGSAGPGGGQGMMAPPPNMPAHYGGGGHMAGGPMNPGQRPGQGGPAHARPPSRTPNPFAEVATSNVHGTRGGSNKQTLHSLYAQQHVSAAAAQPQQQQQQQQQPSAVSGASSGHVGYSSHHGGTSATSGQGHAGTYGQLMRGGGPSEHAHSPGPRDDGDGDYGDHGPSKRSAQDMESAASPQQPESHRRNLMMPPPPKPPSAAAPPPQPGSADPNPFLSFHHAAQAGGLKESGGTLDLGTLPSLQMDPSLFGGGAGAGAANAAVAAGGGPAQGASGGPAGAGVHSAAAIASAMQAGIKGGYPLGSLGSTLGLMSEDLEGHFPSMLMENMETSIQNGGGSIEVNLLQQLLAHHQQAQAAGAGGAGQEGMQHFPVPTYNSTGPLFTVTSGLDTMQSIEQALDAIQR